MIVDYSIEDIGTGIVTTIDSSGTGRLYRRTIDDLNVLDEVRFSNIERFNVNGTSKTDQLAGGQESDVLSGNAGDDFVTGNRGNDLLSGGDGNDRLLGTYNSNNFVRANFPGAGEVDTLTGGAGADTFVLGDRFVAYYIGQKSADYALITDFNPTEGDVIELFGSANNYQLAIDDIANNVGIYANQDLVAVIAGTTNFDLTANYVHYPGQLPMFAQPIAFQDLAPAAEIAPQSFDRVSFKDSNSAAIADSLTELQSRGSTSTSVLMGADLNSLNQPHPLLQADTMGATALNQSSNFASSFRLP